MAVITLYVTDTAPVSPNWFSVLSLTPPSLDFSSFGWQQKNLTVPRFFLGMFGATAQGVTSQTTSYIDSSTGPKKGLGTGVTVGTNQAGDSFISPVAYSGTFAAGNWQLIMYFTASVNTVTGRCRTIVWKSKNADGSSATKLTSSTLVHGIAICNSTAIQKKSEVFWAAPAITLDNEYLFFEMEWEETTVGTQATSGCRFYLAGVTYVVTTDFVPGVGGVRINAAIMA